MGNSPIGANIANGYHEDIRARVTVNKILLKRKKVQTSVGITLGYHVLELGVDGSTTEEFHYEHIQQIPGFTKIRSSESLPFSISGNDGKVWVTITCKNEVIAENYPLRNGAGVIVDARGIVKRAELNEIWMDDNGYDHTIGHCGQKRMTYAEKWKFRENLL